MDQHHLKQAFADGTRVYGTMIASPSPQWVGEISRIGVDFVFIDTEHMPLERAQTAWMCQAYRALGIAPIVRIPSPDPYLAAMALDGGAAGIVPPYLETREQLNAVRGAVKYRPLKGKRLSDVLEGRETLSPKEQAYLRQYNNGNLLILNIESAFAIEHLTELVTMPDVDAVFIGPHDLSINIGEPEAYDHPLFAENVERVIRVCREHRIGVGNHFSFDIEKQLQWARMGMNILLWNADIIRFVQALSGDFAYLKSQLGDGAGAGGGTKTELTF